MTRDSERLAALEIALALFLMFVLPVVGGQVTFPPLSDTVATMMSVVLGALLAIATQAFFADRQLRDARLATAFSVFHKVQLYTNVIGQLSEHILAASSEAGGDDELWRFLEPMYFHRVETAQFAAGELAIFSGDGDIAYADDLMNLTSLHELLLFS